MAFPSTTVQMKKRIIALILAISVLGSSIIIGRLFQLQVVQAEDLQKRAARQQMRVTSLSAQRGTIYDRNGEILARSGTVWTVYLSPVDIDSEEERSLIAKGLSEILDVTVFMRQRTIPWERAVRFCSRKKNIRKRLRF